MDIQRDQKRNGLLFAQTLCLKNVNVSLNFFMKNSQFFPTVSTTYIHKKRTNNLYKALIQHPSKKLQTYRILTDFESWSFLDCLIRLFRPPYVKTFSVQFFFFVKNLHFLTDIYEMWRSKQNQKRNGQKEIHTSIAERENNVPATSISFLFYEASMWKYFIHDWLKVKSNFCRK